MLAEHFVTQERILWAAIVALEEGAALASDLGKDLEPVLRDRLKRESRQRIEQAQSLRELLSSRQSFAVD